MKHANNVIDMADSDAGAALMFMASAEQSFAEIDKLTDYMTDTSKDLRQAKIFVSVLGGDEQWKASMAALTSALGFVRNWLRQHLDLRVTPELDFRPDRSMEHAARIQALLKDLKT